MMMRLARLIAAACLSVSDRMDKAAAARARYSVFEEPAGGPGSPQVIVMKDYETGMEAAVAPSRGGELASLRVRYHQLPVELMYHARDYGSGPDFRGNAPILWPANDGLAKDAFAKDLAWTDAGHSSGADGARVAVELRDSEPARARYPFGFVVRAEYELANGRLTIAYTVSAAGRNPAPMPFSLGNHMEFRLPFLVGTEPEAMRLHLPGAGEMPASFATPARLGDFDRTPALPLVRHQGAVAAQLIDPQGLALNVSRHAAAGLREPAVRFHVYGGPRQGFLCLEPWFGTEDSANSRTAQVMLNPGGDFRWTVELYPEVALDPSAMISQTRR